MLSFGLGVVNGQSTARAISFNNWQKGDGLPSNNINAITKDKFGFLWIATLDGLCRYDGPNLIKVYRKTQEKNGNSSSLQSNNIRSLLCDAKGNLWIGTQSGGLTKLNIANNEWKTYRHDPQEPNSLIHDEVLCITEDAAHQLWIGTEKGLCLFNPETENFTAVLIGKDKKSQNDVSVLSIMEDEKGWIWVGTWANGLYLLLTNPSQPKGTHQFRPIQVDLDRAANNIWTIYQDNNHRYWVGTHGGGLFLMQLPQEASNRINHQNWRPTFHKCPLGDVSTANLQRKAIQAILQDDLGNLWVGTVHGLYLANKDDLSALNQIPDKTIPFQANLSNPNHNRSIIGNNIMNLYEDSQGLVWVATTDGLSQYNRFANQFNHFYFPEADNNAPYTPNFYVDEYKTIWVGSSKHGVLQYRIENNQIVPVNRNLKLDILGERISTSYSPDQQWLYVGTELGITAIHLKTFSTIKYPVPAWVHNNIKDFFIKTIMIDQSKNIWLGTKVGLFIIDAQTKEYSLIESKKGEENGLSDNSVNQILQDTKGNIWIATYNGLNRVKEKIGKNLQFERYFFNEQKRTAGPVHNAIITLKEGKNKLYIGTIAGLCSFNYETKKFEAYTEGNKKPWIHAIAKTTANNLWLSTNEGLFYFDTNNQRFKNYDVNDGVRNTSFRLGSSFSDAEDNIYFAFDGGFVLFNNKTLVSNTSAPPVYITEIEKTNPNRIQLIEGIAKEKLNLNHNDYRIALDVAVLNYNRADKNKFAYRLMGFEERWNDGKIGMPIIYTNLKPQRYTLQVKAANNDGIWNDSETSISIIRHPAFWETWWFKLLIIGGVTTIVWGGVKWYLNNIRKHNAVLQGYNQKLNKSNEELKRSNRDLEQFAYIATHDLKEPLRIIGNFSGLLAKQYKTSLDKEAFEYINFIEEGVLRMSNLINSILTYSRVGGQESTFQEIHLNSLLETKQSELSQLIKERNASIKIGDLPTIHGEKTQIGMVFANLIHNAIKFNKSPNPTVFIQEEAAATPDFWKFSIRDNGIGIKEAYQKQIFGIFKRLHNRKTYEGTGIGLALCQKIIFRHQGKIWVESTPNEGSTFFFTIKKS